MAVDQLSAGNDDGTVLGQSASDLISFHGATPSDQAAFIADPTGGATTDAEARAAIASILDVLIEKGLIAAS